MLENGSHMATLPTGRDIRKRPRATPQTSRVPAIQPIVVRAVNEEEEEAAADNASTRMARAGSHWGEALPAELFDQTCDFLSGRELLTRVERVCRAWRVRSLQGCGWRDQLGPRGEARDGGVWAQPSRSREHSDSAVLLRLGARVRRARHLRLHGSCAPLLSPAVFGALAGARLRSLFVQGCVLPPERRARGRCKAGCAPVDVLWAVAPAWIGAPDAAAIAAAAVARGASEYKHTTGLELRACWCAPREAEDERYAPWLARLGPVAYLKLDGVGLGPAALRALAAAPAAAAVRFMVLERLPALQTMAPGWLGAFDNLRDLVLGGARLACLPSMRHLGRLSCHDTSFGLAPPPPDAPSPWPALRDLTCDLQRYAGADTGLSAATFVALASACAPTLTALRFRGWPQDVPAQAWVAQLVRDFPRLVDLEISEPSGAWSEWRVAVRARAPTLRHLTLAGYTGASIVDDLLTEGDSAGRKRLLESLALRSRSLPNADVYRLCAAHPRLTSLVLQCNEAAGFCWSAAAAEKLCAAAPGLEYLELLCASDTLSRQARATDASALPFRVVVC